MATRAFNIPERNNTLRLKEAELNIDLALNKKCYEQEHLVAKFLDYCEDEVKKAKKERPLDTGYINQCQRRIDRYTPLQEELWKREKLEMHISDYRKQMDSTYNDLKKSGEI